MENRVVTVPEEIDIQIAKDALRAMAVRIDRLTPDQVRYANSW